MRYLYIASQDKDGAILCCTLTPDGQLRQLHRFPIDRAAFLAAEGRTLYALLREPFMMQSGVAALGVADDGSLTPAGEVQPVHGTISAHILAWKGRVYTANYLSGTTTLLPDKLLAHSGSGPNKVRQDCSHPHCLTPTPDGRYLCINDLGTDRIYICTPELEEVSRTALPAGSGPRHLVFSGDGKYAYCSNEMGSSVSVLSYTDGALTLLDTVSTLPEGYTGENSASAIRLSPDSRKLYVSNRGHNSVCVFDTAGPKLRQACFIPSCGDSPREIYLLDRWLLCANENSDTITVLPADGSSDTPVCVFPVKRPWCILPVEV